MQGSTAECALAGAADGSAARDGQDLAAEVGEACWRFLQPLLRDLDTALDVRLVRTLATTVSALVRHRNRATALLLSGLGAYLAGPTQAPAGTKRLANLVHSPRWQAQIIDDWLLEQGRACVEREAARVPEGRAQ